MRNELIDKGISFTFETVLSTDRNLKLLQMAKEKGYFIRCIYVLTANPRINVSRVFVRAKSGGHDVPKEKILSRYDRALRLIPELLDICDVCHAEYEVLNIFYNFKTYSIRQLLSVAMLKHLWTSSPEVF